VFGTFVFLALGGIDLIENDNGWPISRFSRSASGFPVRQSGR